MFERVLPPVVQQESWEFMERTVVSWSVPPNTRTNTSTVDLRSAYCRNRSFILFTQTLSSQIENMLIPVLEMKGSYSGII